MADIKIMSEKLANMIAAGEVVLRPSSVVKELMENAIDAKASAIEVHIKDFGMNDITVIDDGIGMNLENAKRAFLRHATSKLYSEHELSRIQTLGFRGEALASIQSVSKVILKTRQKNTDGVYVTYEGGHFIQSGYASLNVGTIVTVTDLFYNVPARFKYIKSEMAERNSIIDIFDRMALANPNIRFKLVIDDKLVKETYNDGYETLIQSIYGKNVLANLTTFEETFQKIKFHGYLIHPSVTRSHKRDISLFVNGRYIKNYSLVQAVVDGYKSYLMTNRYPIAMIHLTLDPTLIDVNVHPQKLEIKFVNESLLSYHIENFIKKALNRPVDIPSQMDKVERFKHMESFNQQTLDFNTQMQIMDTYEKQEIEPKIKIEESLDIRTPKEKIPAFDYVGTFAGTYLLFQNEEGLYLIDQHAAQERIRYEYYQEKFKKPVFVSRNLLFGMPLKLTSADFEILKSYEKIFNQYGFKFHNEDVIALPAFVKDLEVDIMIESMLEMLKDRGIIDVSILKDQLAKDRSCKTSIKANQRLSYEEIIRLVNDLRTCENPYHCPHGRPTIIKLSHTDIEKMFRRIV